MKRIGNLFEQVCSMENLRLAHKHARKGKGWYKEVQKIDKNPDKYLLKLRETMLKGEYKTSSYIIFNKKEGNKIRTICKLPYYPDRIAQWAIIQVIEPYLISRFTTDTYSSIPNRGIHSALNKLKKAVHNLSDNAYCLKLDVKHFYQNINHTILKQDYAKIFKDKQLLNIIYEIIDSINTAEEDDLKLFYGNQPVDENTGIPIGNYLSQYSGNLYLSGLDHYIKGQLKVKYYFRYMDDIVIVSENKAQLQTIKNEVEKFLSHKKLIIKPNWQIFRITNRGIDFLGYRVFKNYITLRKNTYKIFRKRMAGILEKGKLMTYRDWSSINSYFGWLSHCNGFHLYNKYIVPLIHYYKQFYKNNISKNGTDRKLRKNLLCNTISIVNFNLLTIT